MKKEAKNQKVWISFSTESQKNELKDIEKRLKVAGYDITKQRTSAMLMGYKQILLEGNSMNYEKLDGKLNVIGKEVVETQSIILSLFKYLFVISNKKEDSASLSKLFEKLFKDDMLSQKDMDNYRAIDLNKLFNIKDNKKK